MRLNRNGLLAAAILLPIFLNTSALADLYPYVEKYQQVQISEKALSQLTAYEHLIEYFTGFSYLVPRHKVSRDFIRALILAESGGNPAAVSKKDALGLGQILLPTARRAAEDLYTSRTKFQYIEKERLRDLSREDLFDPAINILLTCYLVAQYNYKFEGKLELVLSAWNAGEHTKSLAYGEHAPYEETKDLIGKVNGYYLYFLKQNSRRLGQKTAAVRY